MSLIWISTSCNCASACLCWCLRWRSTPIQLRGLYFLMLPISSDFNQKKHIQLWIIFASLIVSPFHCNYARKNLKKINKLHPWKCSATGEENSLVDTTVIVSLSSMTVNLPFSLLSIYIFTTHYLFYFDYRQHSILIFKWLTCCLHPILFTWFRLGSLGFPTGFPKIVFSSSNIFPYFRNRPWLKFPFITRYLHVYWTSKATNLNGTDRKITNKISRTFL